MSGGTLVALVADELEVDPNAALGPVDPQIGEYPAASIVAASEEALRARPQDPHPRRREP
jgi:ClpP class serine protease